MIALLGAVMDWFKDLDLRNWWIAVLFAGVAISTAAIAVKLVPAILIGLGIMAIGVGEWINHPYQEQLGQGYKITGHPRRPKPSGLLIGAVGVLLLALGLYRLIMA